MDEEKAINQEYLILFNAILDTIKNLEDLASNLSIKLNLAEASYINGCDNEIK